MVTFRIINEKLKLYKLQRRTKTNPQEERVKYHAICHVKSFM